VLKACQAMPAFTADLVEEGQRQKITNQSIGALAEQARQQYGHEDYPAAAGALSKIAAQTEQIPEFDRLIVRYLSQIAQRFELLAKEFEKKLEGEILTKLDVIFEPRYKTAYQKARDYIDTYEKLKTFAMNSPALGNKKSTWYSLVEDRKEKLKLEFYSGKR
jgi:hypothetical protein